MVEPNLIGHYSFVAKKRYRNGEIEYDSLKSLIKQLIKICDTDTIKFKQAKESLYNELGARSAYYFDCDYVVQKLKPNYEKNKKKLSLDEKMEIIKTLKRAKCDEANLFLAKVMNDYKTIIEIEITSDPDIIDRENIALRDGKIEEAKKYYAQGLEHNINKQKRFKAAMRLAKLHQRDKEWNDALKYFNKASELNPSSGEPYISRGMLLLSANKNCSEFERKLVVCAALDQFEKAKKYTDTREEAIEKIKKYSEFLPTKESLFQRGIAIGSKRTVGCVLKAKTVIRAKSN